MKPKLLSLLSSCAGLVMVSPLLVAETVQEADAFAGFEGARRPITNPTLFDLALPRTQLHPVFMHHRFPSRLNLAGGGTVAFGGDLQLYALQFEYAFNDRFSLVALKDGFVDFNPDNTFGSEEGFANVGGGFKYAFHLDAVNRAATSASVMFELPIGSDDVFQGEGDGNLNITLQTLKLHDRWQFAGAAGIQIPVDSDFSTQAFLSGHISYEVSPWFTPLVELNWFGVLDEGDGSATRFGGVPSVAPSEGADLINWGAGSSEDYVTLGLGFRTRVSENLILGFAYEIPLTDENDNLTEDRFTIDAVWSF